MRNLLFIGAAALMAFATHAQESYTPLQSAMPTDVSHNGKYVVGYHADMMGSNPFSSFIYDVNTQTTDWRTNYAAADLDETGTFMYVTDTGIVAGAIRDKDLYIEYDPGEFAPAKRVIKKEDGETVKINITSAALWKADGTLVKLGIGNRQVSEFTDADDGTYAIAVSDDGSVAVGYIQIGYVPSYACMWKLNAEGEYVYTKLQIAENCIGGAARGISSDGKLAYGYLVRDGEQIPTIWDLDSNTATLIPVADFTTVSASADAISPDGKYLLVTAYNYANSPVVGICDIATGEIKTVNMPVGYNMPKGLTISNNGELLVSLTNTSNWNNIVYYCDVNTGTVVEFDKYIQSRSTGVVNIPSLNEASSVYGSSDFSVLAGCPPYRSGWVLTLPAEQKLMLNAPVADALFFSAPRSLTFKWKALDNVPEGAIIKEYVATIDKQKVTLTPDKAVDGIFTATVNVNPGTYTAYVKAVATTDKGEIESENSLTLTAAISADTDWRLFDNWDDCSIDQMGNIISDNDWWNASLTKGSTSEVIQWNIESYNYENNTPYYTTTSIATVPWSSVLLSRFMNASDQNDMYLSYYLSCQLVNEIKNNALENEYLDVEYSIDGENWQLINRHCAADLVKGVWNFYKTDVSSILGDKVFQIRFNANGPGNALGGTKWSVDVVTINDELEGQTPTGLVYNKTDKGMELTWQNTINAYEVSYIPNTNILTDYCTGSEGYPLITAVDLTPEMTDPYADKYITSVSCFLFDNPAIYTNEPTQAEAIVYADGVEVSRNKYNRDFNSPFATVIPLKDAVKIEKGKKYRIAVRIFDYDVTQTPVYYLATDEYIPGVTDLYSEDEGNTWLRLCDAFSEGNPNGHCIWPLRANITETNELGVNTALDENIIAYNVLRDGKMINDRPIYAAYLKYIDKTPVEGAEYTVQAFYRDGRISPVSSPATVDVKSVIADRPMIDVVNGMIVANGNIKSIEIFALDGTKVAATKASNLSTAVLSDGIYIVRVYTTDGIASRKIAIRR